MTSKRTLINRIVFGAILLGVLTVFMYYVTINDNLIHADEISGIFLARDIVRGNFLLKNWNLSTGLFLLPIYSMIVWEFLLPSLESYDFFYFLSALHYACLVAGFAYIVGLSGLYGIKKKFSYEAALIIVFLLIIPRSQSVLNAGTHTLAHLVCGLNLFIMGRFYAKNVGIKIYIVNTIIISFLAVTNSIVPFYAITPIFIVGIYRLIKGYGTKKQNLYFVLFSFTDLILWKLGVGIWEMLRGASFKGNSTVFCDKTDIVNNIIQTISNILEGFGVNIWKQNIFSFASVKAMVGIVILGGVLYYVYSGLKKIESDNKILIEVFVCAAMTVLLAFCMSNMPAYSQSVHLMEPFVYFLIISFGIVYANGEVHCTIVNKYYLLPLCLSIVFFVLNFPGVASKTYDEPREEIAEWLVENKLYKGFGTYWEATPIMYLTDEKVTIAPIIWNEIDENYPMGAVEGWRWMAKDDWLNQEGTFFVFENDNPYGVTMDRIIQNYGNVLYVKQFENHTVVVMDKSFQLVGIMSR